MDLDIITQYVLSIGPAVTAVAGMITTVIVAIKKVKAAAKDSTDMVKETYKDNRELRKELKEVLAENALLKKEQRLINAKLDHKYFIDKEE